MHPATGAERQRRRRGGGAQQPGQESAQRHNSAQAAAGAAPDRRAGHGGAAGAVGKRSTDAGQPGLQAVDAHTGVCISPAHARACRHALQSVATPNGVSSMELPANSACGACGMCCLALMPLTAATGRSMRLSAHGCLRRTCGCARAGQSWCWRLRSPRPLRHPRTLLSWLRRCMHQPIMLSCLSTQPVLGVTAVQSHAQKRAQNPEAPESTIRWLMQSLQEVHRSGHKELGILQDA